MVKVRENTNITPEILFFHFYSLGIKLRSRGQIQYPPAIYVHGEKIGTVLIK